MWATWTFSTLVGRKSMAALFRVTTVKEKRDAPCKDKLSFASRVFFSFVFQLCFNVESYQEGVQTWKLNARGLWPSPGRCSRGPGKSGRWPNWTAIPGPARHCGTWKQGSVFYWEWKTTEKNAIKKPDKQTENEWMTSLPWREGWLQSKWGPKPWWRGWRGWLPFTKISNRLQEKLVVLTLLMKMRTYIFSSGNTL